MSDDKPEQEANQPLNMKMIRPATQNNRHRVIGGIWRGYQHIVSHRWIDYMVFVILLGGGLVIATMVQEYLITAVKLPTVYVNTIGAVIVMLYSLLIAVALLIRMDVAWSNEEENQ